MDNERTQKIRERAHALWEQAGRPHGQDAEHWAQAERDIAAEDDAEASDTPAPTTGRRGRKPKAAADGATGASAETKSRAREAVAGEGDNTPKTGRGRTKAAPESADTSPAAGKRRTSQAAAAGEGEMPKATRGRKPKTDAKDLDGAN